VVDAADEHRLPEARYEINRLLEDASFAAKPILIVANKCDLPHLEPEKIIQGLVAPPHPHPPLSPPLHYNSWRREIRTPLRFFMQV